MKFNKISYKDFKNLQRNIYRKFDFNKVQKVMQFLDWSWGFESKVPSIDTIKIEVDELFDDLYFTYNNTKDKEHYIKTGGFEVSYTNYGEFNLNLKFVLENWNEKLI